VGVDAEAVGSASVWEGAGIHEFWWYAIDQY
jgi:hypothetical protein